MFVAEERCSNFALPHFVTDWGVVIDFSKTTRTLFHLVHDPSTRKMSFPYAPWIEEWSKNSVPVNQKLVPLYLKK